MNVIIVGTLLLRLTTCSIMFQNVSQFLRRPVNFSSLNWESGAFVDMLMECSESMETITWSTPLLSVAVADDIVDC